jgi:hypothetical protein
VLLSSEKNRLAISGISVKIGRFYSISTVIAMHALGYSLETIPASLTLTIFIFVMQSHPLKYKRGRLLHSSDPHIRAACQALRY